VLEGILVGIIDASLLRKAMQSCSGVDTAIRRCRFLCGTLSGIRRLAISNQGRRARHGEPIGDPNARLDVRLIRPEGA
jgi:hypothetical protein